MQKDVEYIELLDEQGEQIKFKVITYFQIDEINGEYVVVTPAENNDSDEAFVLKVTTDEDENEMLIPIEDEKEFDLVEEAYNLVMAEQE
ncbi:DUF1292 domain-containing protein [Clostridium taeniosporum]|uniref:UPF0473 protein BGI42_05365 n=1 Tax=Clostridium taeniosporum TaxID=394958 RepID=A0A1D7XJ26_9CLOT|nr:DUF1292 domain-containing protein [Clostridium taeniosporum]AOR23190.1 DUF1292 domain-containing protein [Clostridium taeniosporum]